MILHASDSMYIPYITLKIMQENDNIECACIWVKKKECDWPNLYNYMYVYICMALAPSKQIWVCIDILKLK